jgi:hypothetical protein
VVFSLFFFQFAARGASRKSKPGLRKKWPDVPSAAETKRQSLIAIPLFLTTHRSALQGLRVSPHNADPGVSGQRVTFTGRGLTGLETRQTRDASSGRSVSNEWRALL